MNEPISRSRFLKFVKAAVFAAALALSGGGFYLNAANAVPTSGDLPILSNTNGPNVFIFLDTSGSMSWNEGVNYSGSGGSGYDAPESWNPFPGSNSVYSKIYNAKMALADIINSPIAASFNIAFATFNQSGSSGSDCFYSISDPSFTNPANALHYPGSPGNSNIIGGNYEPDESGQFWWGWGGVFDEENCTSPANITLNGTTEYFMSYDYNLSENVSLWTLYIPLTVDGALSTSTGTTIASNPNNAGDPYFTPDAYAGPAINWLLWDATGLYGTNFTNPAGVPVSGIKAGGMTPMDTMVKNMIAYFTNSLQADTAAKCRKDFSIIITDGEANGSGAANTPSDLYELYSAVNPNYNIETFVVGFGYSGLTGGGTYIQQMADAGAGIDPSQYSSGGISFSNVAAGATADVLNFASSSPAAFNSTNGILVGDTVSDNGWESSDCETNNGNSGIYPTTGFDCAVVTNVNSATGDVTLSNPLSNISSGTVTLSGTVYLTFYYNQLIDSLNSIFSQITKQSVSSFTSPVVHEVPGVNNLVYYTNFLAPTQPLWGEGNIFLFQENSQGQLTGTSGSAAVNALGQINTGVSLWGAGGIGAGGELQSEPASSRFVATGEFNATTGTASLLQIGASNDTALESFFGLSTTNYGYVCPGSISEKACADNIIAFILDPNNTNDNWKLGAIYHANPVLISPPPYLYLNSSSYQAFKTNYSTRRQVLVAAANDGMIHGFKAGQYGTGAGSTTTTYGYGSGAELFGYIPPDFLEMSGAASNLNACVPTDATDKFPPITCWYNSSISGSSYYEFADSTPSASDVFFNNVFLNGVNGDSTTFNTAVDTAKYPVSSSNLANSWHTILIGGERDGGSSYYEVGLTNPPVNIDSITTTPTYPDPLWDISDPYSTVSLIDGVSPMGNTWSEPSVSYVCVPNPDYSPGNNSAPGTGICGNYPGAATIPQYAKVYAAFEGGGYSSIDITNTSGSITGQAAGNAVYAFYAEPNPSPSGTSGSYTDEQIMWKFDSSKDSHMTYSIPSAISPVLSAYGMMEDFYVGDLGGQMWAFNIPYGETPTDIAGKANWTGCRIFASSQTNPPLNIYFPPALSYDAAGNLWVFFGTGDRENLSAIPASGSRENEFIGLNTVGAQGLGECAASGPYSESNLTNQTGVIGVGAIGGTSYGWYITFSPGERLVGTPVVYDDVVYFTTYNPTVSATQNACTYSDGNGKLYALYYLNGGGLISGSAGNYSISLSDTSTAAGASQSMSLGSGVPSSPVISSGGNLIVTNSTGAVITMKVPSLHSNIIPTSWFQMP